MSSERFVDNTDGSCFFTINGQQHNVNTLQSKMVRLFRKVTGIPGLKVGVRVLRHLLADSVMYGTVEPGRASEALAFLAGHTKATEVQASREME